MANKEVSTVMDFLSSTNKLLGKDSKTFVKNPLDIVIEKFPTGSYLLDQELKGGWAKGTIIELFGENQSGKAQPLSSNILTPKGFVKMSEIKEGDIVNTPDNNQATVIGIFPQGMQDVYEITFDDGCKTKCTLDHLWEVYKTKDNLREILTTSDIIKNGINTNNNGGRRYKVIRPSIQSFDTELELPINPYLFGFLLGDGHFKGGVSFSTADGEILEIIDKIIETEGYDLAYSKSNKYDYRFRKKSKRSGDKNILTKKLIELELFNKLSSEKYIPEIYKNSSINDRIQLLQGLMDSDGSVEKKNSLSVSTVSLKMCEDICYIARSLGMRATYSNRITKYTNSSGRKVDGKISYRISLSNPSLDIIPFKLSRKKDKYLQNYIKPLYTYNYITNIEKVGRENCQCIKIDHPDELYITDDFIVTHNTTTAIHAVAEHQKKYPDEPVLWIDLEKVFDPEYFQKIGINIDPDKFILARPQGGENTWEVIINFVKTFGKGIVILDSYSLLLPKKEDEGMMGDAQMGAAARMNSQGLRKIFPYMDMGGTTIFALNQIRSSIGGYGDPNVTTGGKGLPFYARTRIKTSASKGLAGEYAIHKFHQVKSNYGMKDRVTETTIVYGEGFNLVKEILVAAIAKDIIQKSGSWFSYNGDKLGQGMDNIAQLLKDNPELFEEIEYKVRNTATVEQEEYIEEDELEV